MDFSEHTVYNTNIFGNNTIVDCRIVTIRSATICVGIINMSGNYLQFNIRLIGIEGCKSYSDNADSKRIAHMAKNRLFSLVTNGAGSREYTTDQMTMTLNKGYPYMVKLKCFRFDKFGNLLGQLFSYNETNFTPYNSFNDRLLKEKVVFTDKSLTEDEQLVYMT